MIEAEFKRLCEIKFERELTSQEGKRLEELFVERPDLRKEFELERLLGLSMKQLPKAAVASNFTRQVLQGLDREARQTERKNRSALDRLSWTRLFRPAMAGVLLVSAGLFSWNFYRAQQQDRMLETVAALSEAPVALDIEVLENFELVELVGNLPEPDTELLALLD